MTCSCHTAALSQRVPLPDARAVRLVPRSPPRPRVSLPGTRCCWPKKTGFSGVDGKRSVKLLHWKVAAVLFAMTLLF